MESPHPLITVGYGIFIWWFSTGAIMSVYGRSQRVVSASFAVMTVALVAAVGGLLLTRARTDPLAVMLSVTCAVIIWGWQVGSYYLGFVTGARRWRDSAARPVGGWARFVLALRFSLYHELAAAAGALVIALITVGQLNPWGLWMYLALWLLHTSAKLNIFFGVRNFSVAVLPAAMRYLDVVLGKARGNPLFPISITVEMSALAGLAYTLVAPNQLPGHEVGALLVGTMVLVGLAEHALLMLPIPAVLWGWGIRLLPQQGDEPHPVVAPMPDSLAGGNPP